MYRGIKRLIDIVLSGLAIVCSVPFWIITIIGIELSDPGPIFYKANRIGKGNREFSMYKFRSMRVLRETKKGSEASLRPETDRIFPWGRVIRKLKLDELPQFLNILLGDMSIIGPRPVAKDQIDLFRFGKYDEAKKVKPGISGPAALYDYIYGDQFEEANVDEYMKKVYPTRRELEYVYVKKEGFLFDTWIFFETAWCVILSIFDKENTRLGFSDHVAPDETMMTLAAAYMLGAEVIEKHFTLDKTLPGNDHYHAGEPEDFKKAIANFKWIDTVLGSNEKTVLDCEIIPRREARRSLVLTRNMKAGEVITATDLMPKRPGTGISPEFVEIVLGRKVVRELEEDTILTWDMI